MRHNCYKRCEHYNSPPWQGGADKLASSPFSLVLFSCGRGRKQTSGSVSAHHARPLPERGAPPPCRSPEEGTCRTTPWAPSPPGASTCWRAWPRRRPSRRRRSACWWVSIELACAGWLAGLVALIILLCRAILPLWSAHCLWSTASIRESLAPSWPRSPARPRLASPSPAPWETPVLLPTQPGEICLRQWKIHYRLMGALEASREVYDVVSGLVGGVWRLFSLQKIILFLD